MVPLPGVGFGLSGLNAKTDKFEFVAYNETGNEIWKKSPANPQKLGYESMVLVNTSATYLAFYETYYKGITGYKNSKKYIRFLDITSGEELFLKELIVDSEKYFGISNVLDDTGDSYTLVGSYASKKDPVNDIGFVLIDLDKEGNMLSEKYLPVSRELNKKIQDEYTRNRIKNRQIAFSKFINLDSKKFFICNLIEGVSFTDFFVLELDKEFSVNDFYFPKINAESNPTNSYHFTTVDKNAAAFTAIFSPTEEIRKGKSPFVGAVSYSGDKGFSSSSLKLTTRPTQHTLLAAKNGYVTIFEYFEKEKKVDLRIEKVD